MSNSELEFGLASHYEGWVHMNFNGYTQAVPKFIGQIFSVLFGELLKEYKVQNLLKEVDVGAL